MLHSPTSRHACLLLLSGALALVPGCGSPTPSDAPDGRSSDGPVSGGTATIGTHREPTTFVDWRARTTFDLIVAGLVMPRLARPGDGPDGLIGDLALAWEVDADGRTIRFRLDDAATWDDGTPITARDVAFSLERQSADGSSIGDRLDQLESVDAPSDHELVVRLARGYAEMLTDVTGAHVYPRHVLGDLDDEALATHEFNRAPLAGASFRLERWEPGQYLAFVPRDDVEPRPRLDRLVVRIFSDKAAVHREMEAGSLDLFRRADLPTYERLTALPHVAGVREAAREYVYLVWNTARAPWGRAEVRRAMTALIDRAALARRFEGDRGRVAEGPVPPGDPRHDPAIVSPPHDPDAARAVLAAEGGPLTVLSLDHPLLRDVAALLADAYREVGFESETRALDWTALEGRVEAGDFDAALYVRPAATPVDLAACFRSDGMENRAALDDAELDRALAGDSTTFAAAYRRVVELQPWTFLFYRSDSFVFNERLRGVDANPRDPFAVVDRWWIDPARE